MKKGTVLLQARMGSRRLPGKVLREIAGKPMIWYAIETLKQAPGVRRIVLATTQEEEDDILAQWAARLSVDCYRGSTEDVLDRFFQATRLFPDEIYFRATGDNPILDKENPSRTLTCLVAGSLEYCCEAGMPLGSIVECFSQEALERCQKEATAMEHREHVTLHMKESGAYRLQFPACPESHRHPQMRLTVDYLADFVVAKKIIEALYDQGIPDFCRVLDYCLALSSDWRAPQGSLLQERKPS